MTALLRKLADPPGMVAWRNFYRRTDPIGGPLRPPEPAPDRKGGSALDTELADPMPTQTVAWLRAPNEAPLEHDRPAWSQIAVHSFYLNEPELKDWVVRLKAALGCDG